MLLDNLEKEGNALKEKLACCERICDQHQLLIYKQRTNILALEDLLTRICSALTPNDPERWRKGLQPKEESFMAYEAWVEMMTENDE